MLGSNSYDIRVVIDISTEKTFQINVAGLRPGVHSLQILCQTIGIINYGTFIERWMRGLQGNIKLAGIDIRSNGWNEYAMLRGEQIEVIIIAMHYFLLLNDLVVFIRYSPQQGQVR
jgi:hypothetical protein